MNKREQIELLMEKIKVLKKAIIRLEGIIGSRDGSDLDSSSVWIDCLFPSDTIKGQVERADKNFRELTTTLDAIQKYFGIHIEHKYVNEWVVEKNPTEETPNQK